jgi:hypothetical protein
VRSDVDRFAIKAPGRRWGPKLINIRREAIAASSTMECRRIAAAFGVTALKTGWSIHTK